MTTGCDMRERLLRHQQENEREMAEIRRRRAPKPAASLRDMKDFDWRQASADESAAMRIVGWMFIVVLGIALGAAGAFWWQAGEYVLLTTVLDCRR